MVNSVLGSKLLDPVVSQAKAWGFICQRQSEKGWLILPRQADRRWKLEQVEDRWILSIDNVPQLRLHTEDALSFLTNRRHEQI